MKQEFSELFSLIEGISKLNTNLPEHKIMFFESKKSNQEYELIIYDTNSVVWKIQYEPNKKNEYEYGSCLDKFNITDCENELKIDIERIFICKNMDIENSFTFSLKIPKEMQQKKMFTIIFTAVIMKFTETFHGLYDCKYYSLSDITFNEDDFSMENDTEIITFDQIKNEYLV